MREPGVTLRTDAERIANARELCRTNPDEPDWFGTGTMALVFAQLDQAVAALQHMAMRRHEWTDWCEGCQSIARVLRVDPA